MRCTDIFKSAITEADGVSVNVGYLSLFVVGAIVLLVIPFLCAVSLYETYAAPMHIFRMTELAAAVKDICFGFAAALAALGAFVWGDRRPTNTP